MYVFIVNPVAGHGRAKRVFKKIVNSNRYKELNSTYYFTEYAGHAIEIGRYLAKLPNIETIIVIGGDGTLHELVNGLGVSRIPLGYIPGGSGNDFARGCNIHGDPLLTFQRIIDNNDTISYWTGKYEINQQQYTFINSIGFGFDAVIAKMANESIYKKVFNLFRIGMLTYVFVLIHVLLRFKPFTVEIETEGMKQKISNCWMITVTNHPYYGGGMKIIPHAKNEPKVFPILLIHSISKWKVLALFFTVFFGKHLKFKEVEVFMASKLKVTSSDQLCFQIDGQIEFGNECVVTKALKPIRIKGSKPNAYKKAN